MTPNSTHKNFLGCGAVWPDMRLPASYSFITNSKAIGSSGAVSYLPTYTLNCV